MCRQQKLLARVRRSHLSWRSSFGVRHWMGATLTILLLAMASVPSAIPRQQSQAWHGTIEGTLRDTCGKPVTEATVLLEEKGSAEIIATKPNADGTFVFSPKHDGTYTVRAKKTGWLDSVSDALAVSPGDKKHIDLILRTAASLKFEPASNQSPAKSSPDTMEFKDEPTFTVAGVTDWSDLGLHGSAAGSKTSEALARDTLMLKSDDLEASHTGSSSKRFEAALAARAKGDLGGSRAEIQKALAMGDDAEGHRLLGEIDERLNDPLDAVREYERAARMDPSERNYFEWGSELFLHKASEPAAEVFTRGSSAYPKSARLLTGLGAALYAKGTYDEAARRLCQAADLEPAEPAPYLFLGKIEKATPAPLPCSEQKLAGFAREQPGNALANYYYAISLWKRTRGSENAENVKQIEALLQKAVASNPKFDEAYLQLGLVRFSLADFGEALRDYQKAIEANPNLAEAHRQLGLLYRRTGETVNAQQEFDAYERIEKMEAAESERQRRELRQFLIILNDRLASAPPQ
jgi:tetratricopeptide (TPR) repeat protein